MKETQEKTLTKNLPAISIILPIRNEEDFIERSLGAVLAQDYPLDSMEVLVVDGMSTDGTRALIRAIDNDHPDIPMTILDNPDRIVPPAMNIGIRQSKGEFIIRVDGHAIVPRDYISTLVESLQIGSEDRVECVTGSINTVGRTYMGQAIACASSSLFGLGGSSYRMGTDKQKEVDAAAFGAWPRSLFDKIGLFNECMKRHQDYEFSHRLRKNGGKILLLPNLNIIYYARESLAKLWSQYYQYGNWKGRFLRTYPGAIQPRHLAPPLFVGSIAVLALFAPFLFTALMLLGMVLGIYLIANLCFSFVGFMKCGLRYGLVLPIVFACIHFSWGLGVLIGIVTGPIPFSHPQLQQSGDDN